MQRDIRSCPRRREVNDRISFYWFFYWVCSGLYINWYLQVVGGNYIMEDELCPTCGELMTSQMDANLNIYLECPSCGYKLHEDDE